MVAEISGGKVCNESIASTSRKFWVFFFTCASTPAVSFFNSAIISAFEPLNSCTPGAGAAGADRDCRSSSFAGGGVANVGGSDHGAAGNPVRGGDCGTRKSTESSDG